MEITPEYAENIIAAIIQNNTLSWYIADKEIWYMDSAKRINQFEEKGYKNQNDREVNKRGIQICTSECQRLVEILTPIQVRKRNILLT